MKEPDSQDPMAKANVIPDAPEREHLGTDEIGPAFDGLSRDDKLKLDAIEAILRRGTGLGKGDVLREALYLRFKTRMSPTSVVVGDGIYRHQKHCDGE